MIDAESRVTPPRVPEMVPECIDPLVRVEFPECIQPTLIKETAKCLAHFRSEEHIISQRSGL
jgi:hypothetical protein